MGLDWMLQKKTVKGKAVAPDQVVKKPGKAGKDGVARRTGMLTSPYDFRGGVVYRGLRDLGEEDLTEKCYDDMTPEEMSAFAEALAAPLAKCKKLQTKANDERRVELVEVEKILEDVQRWSRFWAKQGHGFKV